jgi:hypothetical protein
MIHAGITGKGYWVAHILAIKSPTCWTIETALLDNKQGYSKPFDIDPTNRNIVRFGKPSLKPNRSEDSAVSTISLYGYCFPEDALGILRTNRAKEVAGDCETQDNSAPMITLDGHIWQNKEDAVAEGLKRGNMYRAGRSILPLPAHVKITLEVLRK